MLHGMFIKCSLVCSNIILKSPFYNKTVVPRQQLLLLFNLIFGIYRIGNFDAFTYFYKLFIYTVDMIKKKRLMLYIYLHT